MYINAFCGGARGKWEWEEGTEFCGNYVSTTVYAVASRTYAFYSFNMVMYGGILSFGSAAILYGVNPN